MSLNVKLRRPIDRYRVRFENFFVDKCYEQLIDEKKIFKQTVYLESLHNLSLIQVPPTEVVKPSKEEEEEDEPTPAKKRSGSEEKTEIRGKVFYLKRRVSIRMKILVADG